MTVRAVQFEAVRHLRAWRTALASTPIVIFTFEPSGGGFQLVGRLGDVDVRLWMTDACNAVRLYDNDGERFALVADTAWCSADRAVRLTLHALHRCGAQRPSAAAQAVPGYYLQPGR